MICLVSAYYIAWLASRTLAKNTAAGRCRAMSMQSHAARIEEKIKAEAEIDEYEEGEALTENRDGEVLYPDRLPIDVSHRRPQHVKPCFCLRLMSLKANWTVTGTWPDAQTFQTADFCLSPCTRLRV